MTLFGQASLVICILISLSPGTDNSLLLKDNIFKVSLLS